MHTGSDRDESEQRHLPSGSQPTGTCPCAVRVALAELTFEDIDIAVRERENQGPVKGATEPFGH
jgi:hypothetical protein